MVGCWLVDEKWEDRLRYLRYLSGYCLDTGNENWLAEITILFLLLVILVLLLVVVAFNNQLGRYHEVCVHICNNPIVNASAT